MKLVKSIGLRILISTIAAKAATKQRAGWHRQDSADKLPTGIFLYVCLEGGRPLDAPTNHISAEPIIEIAKVYEFLVWFTAPVFLD